MTTDTARTPSSPVDPRFTRRWSPRSFSDEPVTREQVASLLEAARWAPSCYNDQPWLFVWALEPEDRERVLGLVAEGNRAWAARAPLLGVVFARRTFGHNGKPNRWAGFDAGAASFALALQADAMGLATHFMGGFDEAASYDALGVPREEYEAMAAFAAGRRGEPERLPEPLRQREKPNGRKAVAEISAEGRFAPRTDKGGSR